MAERNHRNECYSCVHMRDVPGNCHIRCVNPDPSMTGQQWGIDKGWFFYPSLFDPVWKGKDCANFKEKGK